MKGELKQGLEYRWPRRLKCDRRGSGRPHKEKEKKKKKGLPHQSVERKMENTKPNAVNMGDKL
jgi:hypothetical protein